MNQIESAETSAQKLPDSEYIKADISDEAFREVHFLQSGNMYRIENPRTLIIRRGGQTHRVVDANGVVHCYVAPESGLTVLVWKSKTGVPVQF